MEYGILLLIIPTLHYSNSCPYRAASVDNVLRKFIPIFFYEGRGRHGRGIAKRTDGITHNVAADVENQIHIVFVALAMLDAVKNFFHPVAALAAGTALPAGFMSIKT
jgi:hypothetical protein